MKFCSNLNKKCVTPTINIGYLLRTARLREQAEILSHIINQLKTKTLREMRLTSVNRFKALVSGAKKTPAAVQNLTRDDLPTVSKVRGEEGDSSVLVDVKYSTINYKGDSL